MYSPRFHSNFIIASLPRGNIGPVKLASATQQEQIHAFGEVAALWKCSKRQMATAAVAGSIPWIALHIWQDLDMEVLARASAQIAALFMGCPIAHDPLGWTLMTTPVSSTVSAACSGADFVGLSAMVFAWHLAWRGWHFIIVVGTAVSLTGPFSILVNAVRIVAVIQMHRWVIPLFPPSCSAFLHLVTGVAVFLPALIFLHATLPGFDHSRRSTFE